MLFTSEEVETFLRENLFKDGEALRLLTMECVDEALKRVTFNQNMRAEIIHAYVDGFMKLSLGGQPDMLTPAQITTILLINAMVDKVYARMVEALTEKASKTNPQ